MDSLTPEQRRYCMSRIKGKNTKPELVLRSALWHLGYRYRLHPADLEGKPDIAFPSKRVAIFVDGCFFHGCPEHATIPKTNTRFWRAKIDRNRMRDHTVNRVLQDAGWTVLRFWEHEVRGQLDDCLARVAAALGN